MSSAPSDDRRPRLRTALTDLLGTDLPIVLAGMTRVSVPRLVAAVSNAGGLGILATAALAPEATRAAIRQVRDLTSRPFGVGVPLLIPGAQENAEVALDERVPVINFSLGKGDWIVTRAHAYGGKVIATVTNERHARAAERYGCDAVMATGHEAAGHGGAVTSLVLIPTLADALRVPVIAVGGIADGRGLAAALALGAAGVAMGTRFCVCRESPLHARTAAALLESGAEDTLYTDRFDGMDCRVLRTPSAERLAWSRTSWWDALRGSRSLAREMGVAWSRLFVGVLLQGPERTVHLARAAGAARAMQLAIEDGDLERGVQPVGQVQALVRDAPPVAELMVRILRETVEARAVLDAALDGRKLPGRERMVNP